MIIAYLIMDGNHPSMCHARYLNEGEAKEEVERLEFARLERNKQIDEHPATGRGSSFMNIKRTEPWSYERREFEK